MASEGRRKSARISEQDARKAQQVKTQSQVNGVGKVAVEQDLGTVQGCLNQKKERKRKSVQDLVINTIGNHVQKVSFAGTSSNGEHHTNAAILSSNAAIPERSKLKLLLSALQRGDANGYFAQPVDADEVEFYYDVIKEPMDFGTIARKLNGGSYVKLEEFERDIFLVFSNAMLFNGVKTVYYKMAFSLKRLAEDLLDVLKTEPEKLEIIVSNLKCKRGKQNEAKVKSLNSNKKKGFKSEDEKPFVNRRITYMPWNSSLNEKKPIVSPVFDSKKEPLVHVDEENAGYKKSLLQFVEGLGPTARMVAERKIKKCDAAAEAFQQYVALNSQLQAWKRQISAADLQKGITTSPPSSFVGSSTGHQTYSIQNKVVGCGTSDANNMNACDGLNGGLAQGSYIREKLGDSRGKVNLSVSKGLDVGSPFRNQMDNQNLGIQLGASLPRTASADGNLYSSATWFTENQPGKHRLTNMMLDASNMDKHGQTAPMASSGFRMQDSVPSRDTGASSSALDWPSEAVRDWTWSRAIGSMQGVETTHIGAGAHEMQVAANRDGTNCQGILEHGSEIFNWSRPTGLGLEPVHGIQAVGYNNDRKGSLEQGREVFNWFKPKELGSEPVLDLSTQWQSRAIENLLGQAEPSQQHGWIHTPDEQLLKALNGNTNCQIPSRYGETSSRGLPNHRQLQPSLGIHPKQWALGP